MKYIRELVVLSVLLSSAADADSGGRLMREQAAYDVKFYRLNLWIDPATRRIGGSGYTRAVALDTLSEFVLDLNSNYAVDSVKWEVAGDTLLGFLFTSGRIWIALPHTASPGDTLAVEVFYSGAPKVSGNPPWDDGFVWSTSQSGKPWAGVACETEGGDCWWPSKDHPSDEPDSVGLNFTVRSDLICVSNGKLIDTVDNLDGTKTFRWFVSNPINNYGVTFYLGDFVRIPVSYTSVTGEVVPSEYWFLPERQAAAIAHIALFLRDMRYLEETCGPYPFRADKYSICDAPYWGMEHQTCIAYGNNFNFNSYGFDYIHYHEFSHEWWGNLVTARDWSDVWIHEGFACYMEALYAEHLNGFSSYKNYMAGLRSFSNSQAVAPRDTLTASEGYNGPVYNKGAWVLHTLRHLIGDSTFFRLLHRWSYPDSAMEHVTDGTQCRLATTDDFLHAAETISGMDLGWFFEVYLRNTGIPRLSTAIVDSTLYLRWYTQNGLPFSLPVDVKLGAATVRVDMSSGGGQVAVPGGVTPVVDPDAWILKDPAPATLSSSPAFLTFKTVGVDSSKTDSITVTNTWATSLTVSSASSDLPDYTVSPDSASIPVASSMKFYVTFAPVEGGPRNGHVYLYHGAPGSPVNILVFGSGRLPSSSFTFSNLWNLVSVPLTSFDQRKSALFPAAVSPAFAFRADSGYVIKDSLHAGAGYWVKFGADQSLTIAGYPCPLDTIEVVKGWNLIGSVSAALAASSVVPLGTSITTSFYGYRNGYTIADSLVPARGYWVKVDTAGKLILGSPSAGGFSKAAGTFLPPNTLTITDGSGKAQTLYFGRGKITEGGRYEMPPKAPEGVFDARFSSGRIAELLADDQSGTFPLAISSARYPIGVSWELSSPLNAALVVGQSVLPLRSSGRAAVSDEKVRIALTISSEPDLPKVYALEQNYPNPFNPVTVIRYQLPVESRVSLTVYNVLGQAVRTLVERIEPAGYRTAQFDAEAFTSGVYFYRLEAVGTGEEAGSFTGIHKMLLVK